MNKWAGMVYQAALNNGLSANQARILTAEIGREGGFLPENLFGVHQDAGKGRKQNLGMLSWQGERRANLLRGANKLGLVKNGVFEQSQRSIDYQMGFLMDEMHHQPMYEKTRKQFLNNPNVDYQTGVEVLGRNFIRWDMDGKHIGKKNADSNKRRRDEYYRQLGGTVRAVDAERRHNQAQERRAANASHDGSGGGVNEARAERVAVRNVETEAKRAAPSVARSAAQSDGQALGLAFAPNAQAARQQAAAQQAAVDADDAPDWGDGGYVGMPEAVDVGGVQVHEPVELATGTMRFAAPKQAVQPSGGALDFGISLLPEMEDLQAKYEKELAGAFGVQPDMSKEIPGYLDALVQSIYDEV